MTKLRIATDEDDNAKTTQFLSLPKIGNVELKMAPCPCGMKIVLIVMSKTGLPEPFPQILPRTVGEDHVVFKWWDRLWGDTLEKKTRRCLKKWRGRLLAQESLLQRLGADLPGPEVELGLRRGE